MFHRVLLFYLHCWTDSSVMFHLLWCLTSRWQQSLRCDSPVVQAADSLWAEDKNHSENLKVFLNQTNCKYESVHKHKSIITVCWKQTLMNLIRFIIDLLLLMYVLPVRHVSFRGTEGNYSDILSNLCWLFLNWFLSGFRLWSFESPCLVLSSHCKQLLS